MLTEIGPNKTELWGRIIGQIVLLVVLGYFVYRLITDAQLYQPREPVGKGWFFAVLILALNISSFFQLYFLPFWIIIDDDLKTLQIKYLMKKPKVVGKHDIAFYCDTTIKLRRSDCFGLFLHLSNGKRILISDLTFDNYMPVELFLIAIKIKKMDEESYSAFSSYRH